MDEFLKQNYSIITHSVEYIAAIAGLLCLKKYKGTDVKYFIWFLVYVALIETIGSYPRFVDNYESLKKYKELLEDTPFEANYWFFTVFWVVGSAVFYTLYFSKALTNKKLSKCLNIVVLLYVLFSLVYIVSNTEAFFTEDIIVINVSGVILIAVSIVNYLIEILKSDKILKFYKSINFYIATTLILWLVTITPLTFYQMYFSTADWSFVLLRWQIFLFANIFMYLTFTFALIYCTPEHD